MPKGVPKLGYRMTARRRARIDDPLHNDYERAVAFRISGHYPPKEPAPVISSLETDEEIDTKLSEKFTDLELFTDMAITGDERALIISGPPGLGKSFTIERKLRAWDQAEVNHEIISGYIRPTGLYKALYKYRHPHNVVVFDDCDKVFGDEVSINMLKAVCDTMDRRRISYRAETTLLDEDTGVPLPKNFEFRGSLIFITNIDFDEAIARDRGLSPHLAALQSRATYFDLEMKTARDYIVRIKQVVRQGLFTDLALTTEQEVEVLDFLDQNSNRFREVSLRSAKKLASLAKKYPADWRRMAKNALFKRS